MSERIRSQKSYPRYVLTYVYAAVDKSLLSIRYHYFTLYSILLKSGREKFRYFEKQKHIYIFNQNLIYLFFVKNK